jgi:molybdopterin synthase catalytic subunit
MTAMIKVQREDFDVGAELEQLTAGRHDIGGVASFVGLVREFVSAPGVGAPGGAAGTGGKAISAMTLEHYPGMTEKKLKEIEAEARQRWPLAAVLIIHRFGRLEPGERIVLVATASAHRQAALEACAFLIDWLKTQAPFWKLEETPEGTEWVEARESDDAAAERWKKPRRVAE